MNPTTQPSEGAVRAAKRFRAEGIGLSDRATELLVRIIDQETGAGELVEALRTLHHFAANMADCLPADRAVTVALVNARKALSRHTSTQGKEGKL